MEGEFYSSMLPGRCPAPEIASLMNVLDARIGILYSIKNKFALWFRLGGGPEFHAEWLRDEP